MGVEYLITAMWLAQGAAGAALAVYSATRGRWLAAAGAALGISIGFLPLHFFPGPAVWGPWIHMTAASTFILCVAYGVSMRWMRFAAVLLLLGLPLAYTLIVRDSLPPAYDFSLLAPLGVVGDMAVLFAPILFALALKEVLGEFDRFIAVRRSA